MTLKEEMTTLTGRTKKSELEEKEKEQKEREKQAKINGEKSANTVIKDLPARIEKEAKNGKSYIYEWVHADSAFGGWKLSFISKWAREQGFKVETSYGNDPANEGGDKTDDLIISW